jgi:hypothetical protein
MQKYKKGKPGPKRKFRVPPKSEKIIIKTAKIRRFVKKPYGPKQKKVLTKKAKRQIAEIRKYRKLVKGKKAAFTRKYNRELVKVMKQKGYFPEDIERAKKYTLTGKAIKAAIVKLPVTRISVQKNKYFVGGKWISKKSMQTQIRNAKYWASVHLYMDLYGITLKEAKSLYSALRGEFGEKIRKAIY